jgi:hypothetical protein
LSIRSWSQRRHRGGTRNYGDTAKEKSNELLYHMLIAVISVSVLIAITLGLRTAGQRIYQCQRPSDRERVANEILALGGLWQLAPTKHRVLSSRSGERKRVPGEPKCPGKKCNTNTDPYRPHKTYWFD